MQLQISPFDLALVFVYLIGVVAIGCYAGSVRRRGGAEGGHYFLAGNTLGWPVIGLAMFAYDVVKRYRTRTSDRQLVVIGKIATAVGTVIAIASSPLFGHKDTIFQALTDLICYAAPPITAVFLFGVFWRRATGRAAFAAMVFGGGRRVSDLCDSVYHLSLSPPKRHAIIIFPQQHHHNTITIAGG